MKPTRHSLVAAAVIATAGAFAPAIAAPIQWTVASGGNDHWYELVQTATDWGAARAAALASSFGGQQGYLATITSAAENTFVASTVAAGLLVYVGGSDAAVEGQWRWVDGPEAGQLFSYTNWNPGEPNDAGGESSLHVNFSGPLGWNDINAGNAYAFVVEYNAAPTSVSAPATLALVLPALLAAAWASRRRT